MAPKCVDNTTPIHRFSDIATEPHTMLMPIEGYEKMPLVTLEEAVEPLVPLVRDVQRRARIEKQRCENPSDNLSSDESASIALYTIEWEPSNDSLYFILNSTLRIKDRTKLKPWFLYLKLLLTALSRLPPIGGRTIYRGIKLNMSHMYSQDKTFVWWGLSSCTTSIKVLEEQEFFGKTGTRTLFFIECHSGRDIHRHCSIENENEVLLLPAIQFKVVSCLDQDNDLHIIQLKEIEPLSPLLEPVSGHRMPVVESPKKLLLTSFMPLFKTKILSSAPEAYRNSKLEKRIAKCEPRSLIDLDRQSLTDQDMPIVVQQAVIDKQCTRLRLSDNKITAQGVAVLTEALHNNTILEGLYIFNNHMADKGVYLLTQVLSENKSALKTLSLGWNDITDEGANYLAEMLKTNRTLIELWLPWNRISDRGVQLLANALIHHNTSLQRLSLDLNKLVTDLSVNILVDVLNHNQSLTALYVRECKLSKAGKAKLHEVEKSKKNIELNL
jgi:hypothetical protein